MFLLSQTELSQQKLFYELLAPSTSHFRDCQLVLAKLLGIDPQATEVGGGFNEPGARTEVTIIIEVSG